MMSCQNARPARNPWEKTPKERKPLCAESARATGVIVGSTAAEMAEEGRPRAAPACHKRKGVELRTLLS